MLAAVVTGLFGTFLGVLLMLAVIAVAMPWLFGASGLGLIARCRAALRREDEALRKEDSPPPKYIPSPREAPPARFGARREPGSGPSGAAAVSRSRTRKTEPWRLPPPIAPKSFLKTPPKAAPARSAGTSNPRPHDEWAPFESIRPTPAMLARANAAQTTAAPASASPQRSIERPAEHAAKPLIGKITRSMYPAPASSPAADRVPPSRAATAPAKPPVSAWPSSPVAAAATADDRHTPAFDTSASAHAEMPPRARPAPEAPKESEVSEAPEMQELAIPYPVPVSIPDDDPITEPQPQQDLAIPLMPEPVQPSAEAAAFLPPSPAQPSEGFAVTRPAATPVNPRIAMGTQFEFQAPSEINVDLPGVNLLDAATGDAIEIPAAELADTAQLIEQRLKEFKVPVSVLGACAGPVITRFEVEPAVGVRGAQIVGLMKDLARALGLTSIRVVETIPGKTCMGLELPNAQRQMIRLSEMLESDAYRASSSHLTLAMGKDITGTPVVTDLARAPHMLVAGTTGSGKSVAINAMILSLLYKSTPADVRMIMIDPKMLELSVYDGIPHLLAPVVTDMKLAANALSWCVAEMDKRYRLMSALGVRNLAGFNQKIRDGQAAGRKVTNPFSLTPDAPEPLSTLPLIVVVIDELADLMMVAGKKIEELIARLAQKARAAGIHLILATQRPSVDVITGLIKANIPTRVAFQVSSKIDSRTVLDQMGAETLLGHGDMLFLPPGSGYPQRVHGAFVSDEEVHRVVEYLKQFGEPEYEEAILAGAPSEEAIAETLAEDGNTEADPLYDEAVAFVIRTRRASISSVQRQLRIGYNRAARLVEQMEAAGLLSAMASNGSREILVPPSMD
jgi:S-DNA-T family DNA segregation ATPase FtsK/SpoIIIE